MNVTAGTSYFIQARTVAATDESFVIARARADHDLFANAVNIAELAPAGSTGAIAYDVDRGTKEPEEPCFQACIGSLWWSYSPTTDQAIDIDLSNVGELAVYTGTALPNLVRVGGTGWNGGNHASLNLLGGTTYWIQIRPFSTGSEFFAISRP